MIIEYLGHSAFNIVGDYSVVTDPFSKIGYEMKRVKADYCLCSHNHFDHNAHGNTQYKFLITESGQKASDINLEIIPSFHDEVQGAKRGKNNIYKFTIDGKVFCHLGDLGESDLCSVAKKVDRVDVLFIPVGGVYTINAQSALKLIHLINPSIAVPMHYKTAKSQIDIAPLDEFLSICDCDVFDKPKRFELIPSDFANGCKIYIPESKDF